VRCAQGDQVQQGALGSHAWLPLPLPMHPAPAPCPCTLQEMVLRKFMYYRLLSLQVLCRPLLVMYCARRASPLCAPTAAGLPAGSGQEQGQPQGIAATPLAITLHRCRCHLPINTPTPWVNAAQPYHGTKRAAPPQHAGAC
jgi:hypothetical protein